MPSTRDLGTYACECFPEFWYMRGQASSSYTLLESFLPSMALLLYQGHASCPYCAFNRACKFSVGVLGLCRIHGFTLTQYGSATRHMSSITSSCICWLTWRTSMGMLTLTSPQSLTCHTSGVCSTCCHLGPWAQTSSGSAKRHELLYAMLTYVSRLFAGCSEGCVRGGDNTETSLMWRCAILSIVCLSHVMSLLLLSLPESFL